MKGSLSAALNLAQLADEIHLTNPVTTRSTDKVSAVYQTILRANVNEPEPSQEIKEKHEAALRVLYRTVKVTDEDTGEVTEKTVPTVAYREYRKLEQAYQAALSAYQGAYLEAQKTEESAETWPLIAPTQRMPVTAAWDDWRGADANTIESALAVVNTTENKAVAIAFSKASELFSSYATSLQGPSAAVTYRSTVIPSGWVSAEEAEDWPTVTISAGTMEETDNQEAHQYAAKGNLGLGLLGLQHRWQRRGEGTARAVRRSHERSGSVLQVLSLHPFASLARHALRRIQGQRQRQEPPHAGAMGRPVAHPARPADHRMGPHHRSCLPARTRLTWTVRARPQRGGHARCPLPRRSGHPVAGQKRHLGC